MPTLPEMQKDFFAGLFSDNRRVVDTLLPSKTLSAEARFDIYRGSVSGLFTQVLAEIYPVCKRLLGNRFFDGMVDHYIVGYPSTSANVIDYGRQFPEFLEGFEPVSGLPYLADTARLEWVWHRAFNARNSTPIDTSELMLLNEDQLYRTVLMLPPGTRLLHSIYPVDTIWQQNQPENKQPTDIQLEVQDHYLLVRRLGYEVRIDRFSHEYWLLLDSINQGLTLGQLSEQYDDMDLQAFLVEAIRHQWFNDFSITNRSLSSCINK